MKFANFHQLFDFFRLCPICHKSIDLSDFSYIYHKLVSVEDDTFVLTRSSHYLTVYNGRIEKTKISYFINSNTNRFFIESYICETDFPDYYTNYPAEGIFTISQFNDIHKSSCFLKLHCENHYEVLCEFYFNDFKINNIQVKFDRISINSHTSAVSIFRYFPENKTQIIVNGKNISVPKIYKFTHEDKAKFNNQINRLLNFK